ncbi:hypothetical protein T10_11387 [Trichinella papuae]|uniref:Uncharacterized protein n=1 Tax=Trichinella papuae TaxID=268474 RepID=A0A0V1N0V1_9BILA|nr:hypothetical protein T10_11387 [Trichinella papuae]
MIKPALVCIYTVGQVKGDDRFLTDRYHISQCEKIHMKHKAELKQGQIFLTLVRRIWALILLAVCLEKAGCPLRVSCGKRKKPANLAPSGRDDDWISEIESID